MRETFGADLYSVNEHINDTNISLVTPNDATLVSDTNIYNIAGTDELELPRGTIKESIEPDTLYEILKKRMSKYNDMQDISKIEKAYALAKKEHDGVKRKSGEDYIVHPIWVAIILADLELDNDTIAAGLLHDVVEDTPKTVEDIKNEFGEEIARLVDGVTKLGQLNYEADKIDVQAENLRKMLLAMSKDIRVILIKLADRLHNMRTLQYMRPEKQLEKARETMDIYAPIADRLGISKIKDELEDLALEYSKPEEFEKLVKDVNEIERERDAYIKKLVSDVTKRMQDAKVECEVYGRVKHTFSIYKKMVNQHKNADEVYDLFAVRVVVDNVTQCYSALGAIHEKYTPVPGRFKDYIAMPKPNGYQSLHTTLIGPTGQPFEIQIRTHEMHKNAEFGIAAHWKYKASGGSKEKNIVDANEEKLSWLREVLEWQLLSDNKEFLSLIKSDLDLFSDHVYCFTPEGDIKNLPVGSTPIDFAYAVHSAVGNKLVGARVNGKLVPIDYKIQNGDRIYIMTSQNSTGPSRDWLNFVKSASAKNKINQWFKKEFKEENITKGKELLANYCKAKGIKLDDINKPNYQKTAQRKYGFGSWEQLLATVGHGGLKEGQVINRMLEEKEKEGIRDITDEDVLDKVSESVLKKKSSNTSGVIVKGMPDMEVHFAKCCTPVPGDEIIGFVTRGHGITVHRTDCVNLINMPQGDRARLISVEWEGETNKGSYNVFIRIYCNSRKGLIVDVSKTLNELDLDILSLDFRISKKGIMTCEVSISVHSSKELDKAISKLRQIEGVSDIERVTG